MPGKFALIIGNSDYRDASLSNLVAPAKDVQALANVLQDPDIGGFDKVLTLLNRPFAELQRSIADFFYGHQKDDLLVLYFSGHGLLDKNSNLYLATVESESRLPSACSLSAEFVAREMNNSLSRRQVLILDCCHSGAFIKGEKGAGSKPVGTEELFSGQGRTILAASDTAQTASEGDQSIGPVQPSVFTRFLVEGLQTGEADRDGDQVVSVTEWYDYTYERVVNEITGQTPVFGTRQVGKVIIARAPLRAKRSSPGLVTSSPKFRTLIVDPLHRGDYPTITEAIRAAQPGDEIRVRPGVYEEALAIDKPLEIVGEGKPGEVLVRAKDNHVIRFTAAAGKIKNLTLRQLGGDFFGVDITGGRLEMEVCDISSLGLACVTIHDGAAPVLRGNRIHDGKAGGIFIYENGQGLIEENEIFGNALSGIEITTGGNPTIHSNRIHDGQQGGVFICENGQGLIEKNEFFGNARAQIGIKTGGNPIVRGNRIHDGKRGGIYIYENGQGRIEENDIFGNMLVGIEIRFGGNPTVRGNRIHDGRTSGILVLENGQGLIEENDIFGNAENGIEITVGGNPTVRGNRIDRQTEYGILVRNKSFGTFERNRLSGNKAGNWYISEDSLANVKRVGNIET